MTLYSIQYGTTQIEYEVEYIARATLAIDVHPDLSVSVRAPEGTSLQDIEKRVKKRARWIAEQQRFFEQYLPRPPERTYVSGETHFYLGKQYRLKVIQSTNSFEGVLLKRGYLQMYLQEASNTARKRTLLDKWYRRRAKKYFQKRLDWWQKQLGASLPGPPMLLRAMPYRWGSYTQSGNILFNPELIKAPAACIDYVVAHELCHMVHPNHSIEFYQLLASLVPDWKTRKDRLETFMSAQSSF